MVSEGSEEFALKGPVMNDHAPENIETVLAKCLIDGEFPMSLRGVVGGNRTGQQNSVIGRSQVAS